MPIDTLPGDRYTYHENVRKIIGQRTRREFSIGDKVRVMLDRVDAAGAQAAVFDCGAGARSATRGRAHDAGSDPIPGGEFLMGQADGRDEERPVHRVTVAPFRLARCQVTNAEYDEFRRATGRAMTPFREQPEFAIRRSRWWA